VPSMQLAGSPERATFSNRGSGPIQAALAADVLPGEWDALLQWYLGAGPLISGLDTCSTIVRSMPSGTADANLLAAEDLSAITHDNELWLLAHPCPEAWNETYLSNMNEMFVAIGELVITLGGSPPEAIADSLTKAITDACAMAGDLHHTIRRLAVADLS
jgi:hypothetical protein